MDKERELKEKELEEKIKQLSTRDGAKGAKVAYVFAESVGDFLEDQISNQSLSLVKRFVDGEDISEDELRAADIDIAYAAYVANKAAAYASAKAAAADVDITCAAYVAYKAAAWASAKANAAYTYAAYIDAYVGAPDITYAADAFSPAAKAVRAAYYARKAYPSITIESQLKIVDKMINKLGVK